MPLVQDPSQVPPHAPDAPDHRHLDEDSLEVLEYPRILAQVAVHAATQAGAEELRKLRPYAHTVEARRRQRQSQEAEALLRRVSRLPVGPAEDVGRQVERARRGAVLSGPELYLVLELLRDVQALRRLLAEEKERLALTELPLLLEGLIPLPGLVARLSACLTASGEVTDQASPLLASLRQKARELSDAIRQRLEHLVRSPETSRYLQEPVVTVRGGRYVVPVRQEFRRHVPGLVHDASQSGQTLFVEPLAVLELGNSLRTTEAQVSAEVERVLAELSAQVGAQAQALAVDVRLLAQLDAVAAGARWAQAQGYTYPELVERPVLFLHRARHPLLGPDAVPLSVELGSRFLALVISGPNTGGKTVALRTMGLLSAMALSGLAIPASSTSQVGTFDHILADIGDEQSVEQSLSTFSSHLSHIVGFLHLATDRSLVLLDELGAGTDPVEGGALGAAILEAFLQKGTRVGVTTHLSELKTFAAEHPACENASVEFDLATLAPTYRFLLGVPGESQAFAIAARLGLPAWVRERAQERLRPDDRRVEELLRSLGEAKRRLHQEEEEARRAREQAQEAARRAQDEAERVSQERARILEEARERARELVRRAKRETQAALEALRQAQRGERGIEAAAQAARQALQAALPAGEEGPHVPMAGPSPRLTHVQVGQRVWLERFHQDAQVLEPPDDQGRVVVQAGSVRLRVDLRELAPPSGAPAPTPPSTLGTALHLERAREIQPELDLRGMRAEEAVERLLVWLDDALLAGLPRGRVIHGKGTGALRRAVAQALQGHPAAVSWRPGDPREGGDGVTVVEFRDQA